jgi:hypothetical protein
MLAKEPKLISGALCSPILLLKFNVGPHIKHRLPKVKVVKMKGLICFMWVLFWTFDNTNYAFFGNVPWENNITHVH